MSESASVAHEQPGADILVEFEFGSVTAKLKTLRTVGIGYLFETNSQINQPVLIKCDGRLVSRGQIMVNENGSLCIQAEEIE